MAIKHLGDLIEALEDYIEEFQGIENFPVVVTEKNDKTDGILTDIDFDGENVILTFEETVA